MVSDADYVPNIPIYCPFMKCIARILCAVSHPPGNGHDLETKDMVIFSSDEDQPGSHPDAKSVTLLYNPTYGLPVAFCGGPLTVA